MSKKGRKKHSETNRADKTTLSIYTIPAIILTLGISFIGLIHAINYSGPDSQSKILGLKTYLAKGDNSGSSQNDSSNSSGHDKDEDDNEDKSQNSDTSSKHFGSSQNSDSSENSNNSISASSKVVCTGPDGNKFTTSFKDCENFNKAWKNPGFSFTILSSENKIKPEKIESKTPKNNGSEDKDDEDKLEIESEDEFEDKKIDNEPEDEKNDDDSLHVKSDAEKTEIRLSETERVRARTKDGLTRIDITSNGIKTRLEQKDGKMIIKAENEDDTEIELEDDTLFKIEERLDKSGIKIATAEGEKLIIQKGITGAVTDFPISIDLATNSLIVNTPTGPRTVTVLPDQAVQNLLALNIVNRIGGTAILKETEKGTINSLNQLANLDSQNGIPVYQINGLSDQKLLGFIPITIEKTITVSAQTGEIVSTKKSTLGNLLDSISF